MAPVRQRRTITKHAGQCCAGVVGIDVAYRDDDRTYAQERSLVPRSNLSGRNLRKRVRQTAYRQPVARLAESRGESQLERIAEHVVRHLLGLDGHEVALGGDISILQSRALQHQLQQGSRLAEMLVQNRGPETEPVGCYGGAEAATQTLKGECQLAGFEITRAAHGAADGQGSQP